MLTARRPSTSGQVKGYNSVAKLLHWLVAIAVFTAIPLGLAMLRVEPGNLQNNLFNLHRSFGALILSLMALRIVWRLMFPPPPRNIAMPIWQARTAAGVHTALYLMLVAIPLVGWAGTSAYPATITVFGLFELPAIVEPDRALSELLLDIHGYMAFVLIGLVGLHIGAALYHHLVRKDDVLRRMLPFARMRKT